MILIYNMIHEFRNRSLVFFMIFGEFEYVPVPVLLLRIPIRTIRTCTDRQGYLSERKLITASTGFTCAYERTPW